MEDEAACAVGGLRRKAPDDPFDLADVDLGTEAGLGVGGEVEAWAGLESLGRDLDRGDTLAPLMAQHLVAALDVVGDEIAPGPRQQAVRGNLAPARRGIAPARIEHADCRRRLSGAASASSTSRSGIGRGPGRGARPSAWSSVSSSTSMRARDPFGMLVSTFSSRLRKVRASLAATRVSL
jgi:hypothetical protein